MKKIIALLLLAVMCLSLVACGKKEEKEKITLYNKYETIIQMLENEKYEEAIYEIYGIYNSNQNSSNDEETDKLEKKYQRVVTWAKSPSSTLADDNGKGMSYNETLKYVYDLLRELGDYKDSATYLSRFTVVTDTLTKITKNTTDAFGQVTESNYKAYGYDVNGECFEFSELYNTLVFVNVVGAGKYQIKDCKYDDNGKIVSIDLRSNMAGDERTILKIAIEYDTNGNITKADFIQHDGKTWSNNYTYDDQGRVVTAILNGIYAYSGWYGTDYSERYEYQYDADGNLIKRTNKLSLGEEYTYTEDDKLLVVDYLGRDKGDPFVTKRETYLYDENGRISAIEVIESKSGYGSIESSDAVKYTLLYHYEDVIIYDKNR